MELSHSSSLNGPISNFDSMSSHGTSLSSEEETFNYYTVQKLKIIDHSERNDLIPV